MQIKEHIFRDFGLFFGGHSNSVSILQFVVYRYYYRRLIEISLLLLMPIEFPVGEVHDIEVSPKSISQFAGNT